jgi:hypothetical protein
LIFPNIDRAHYRRMCAAAEAQTGLCISGDDGNAEGHGVHVSWHYDEPMLTVTPLNLIAKMGSGDIQTKMETLIESTA